MYYAATQQLNTVRHIARMAEQQIKTKTGMRVNIMLYSNEADEQTPEEMLRVIAIALGMNSDAYKLKTRERHIVELRFIAALLMRRNFPKMTLHQIATLFGGQDHTSIINGVARANDLIYIGDPRFVKKYNTALQSVNLWLKNAA
jgi:chromosomal replication initiation ATPase DnaA